MGGCQSVDGGGGGGITTTGAAAAAAAPTTSCGSSSAAAAAAILAQGNNGIANISRDKTMLAGGGGLLQFARRRPSNSSESVTIIPDITEGDGFDDDDDDNKKGGGGRPILRGKLVKSASNGNLIVAWSSPPPRDDVGTPATVATTPAATAAATATATASSYESNSVLPVDSAAAAFGGEEDDAPPHFVTPSTVVFTPNFCNRHDDDDDDDDYERHPHRHHPAPSDEEDNYELADDEEEPGRLVITKLRASAARIRSPSSAALVAPPRSVRNGSSNSNSDAAIADVVVASSSARSRDPPGGTLATAFDASASSSAAAIHPQTLSEFKRLELQAKLERHQQQKEAKLRKYQDRYRDVQSYRKLWSEFLELEQKRRQDRRREDDDEEGGGGAGASADNSSKVAAPPPRSTAAAADRPERRRRRRRLRFRFGFGFGKSTRKKNEGAAGNRNGGSNAPTANRPKTSALEEDDQKQRSSRGGSVASAPLPSSASVGGGGSARRQRPSSPDRRRRSNSFDLHDSSNWYFDFQGVDFAYEGAHSVERSQCNLSLHSESSMERQRRLFSEKRRQHRERKRSGRQSGPPLTCTPSLRQFLDRETGRREAAAPSSDLRSRGGNSSSICDYGPIRSPSSVSSTPAVGTPGLSDMNIEFDATAGEYFGSAAIGQHDSSSCSYMSDLGDDASINHSIASAPQQHPGNDYGVARRRRRSEEAAVSREKLAWLERRIQTLRAQEGGEEGDKQEEKKEDAATDDDDEIEEEEGSGRQADVFEGGVCNVAELIDKFNGKEAAGDPPPATTAARSASEGRPPPACGSFEEPQVNYVPTFSRPHSSRAGDDVLLDPATNPPGGGSISADDGDESDQDGFDMLIQASTLWPMSRSFDEPSIEVEEDDEEENQGEMGELFSVGGDPIGATPQAEHLFDPGQNVNGRTSPYAIGSVSSPLHASQLMVKFNGAREAQNESPGDATKRDSTVAVADDLIVSEAATNVSSDSDGTGPFPFLDTSSNTLSKQDERVPEIPTNDVVRTSAEAQSQAVSPSRRNSPKPKFAFVNEMTTEEFLLMSGENALERAARFEHQRGQVVNDDETSTEVDSTFKLAELVHSKVADVLHNFREAEN